MKTVKTVTICGHGECGGECYRCRLNALQQRLDALVEAVGEMRHSQIEYFRSKSRTALEASKRAERKVDKLLEELRTPRLFN